MHASFPDADQLYSREDAERSIADIAQTLNQDYSDSKPLVITILNGGLVFAGMLLPHLSFDLELDYVHATRYGDDLVGKELIWKAYPQHEPKGRDVLLLDDILDEGWTLMALVKYFERQGAQSVRTAVLVDKQHQRKAQPDLRADYTGLEVPDRYVFGMGMDVRSSWRNAPGIFALKHS